VGARLHTLLCFFWTRLTAITSEQRKTPKNKHAKFNLIHRLKPIYARGELFLNHLPRASETAIIIHVIEGFT
jgi:hypothetical protein